jgi:hypothetical protein
MPSPSHHAAAHLTAEAQEQALLPFRFEYSGPGAVTTAVDRALADPGTPVAIDIMQTQGSAWVRLRRQWIVAEPGESSALRWAADAEDAVGTQAVVASWERRCLDRAYLAAVVMHHLMQTSKEPSSTFAIEPGEEHLASRSNPR